MEIVSLEHAALNVSDLEASKKFYGVGLGLKEVPRPDFDFAGAWYALGESQQLHLIEEKSLVPTSNRRNHHFALRVRDIEAVEAQLKANGIKIAMGPHVRPDLVAQIFVSDPDGYIIELSNT